MKFVSLFTKTPQHKKFSYAPRFYDPREDEMKEREERIRKELKLQKEKEIFEEAQTDYRSRIAGSFKSSRRTASRQSDPSAGLIRLLILTILTILLIAYLQFGNAAVYGLVVIVPFYFYLKFRGVKRQRDESN